MYFLCRTFDGNFYLDVAPWSPWTRDIEYAVVYLLLWACNWIEPQMSSLNRIPTDTWTHGSISSMADSRQSTYIDILLQETLHEHKRSTLHTVRAYHKRCVYNSITSFVQMSTAWLDAMGVSRGANAPPWNLKMMTSYAVPLLNTLNFSLAPSALVWNTPKFSLNPQKSRIFALFAVGTQKINNFFHFVRFKCP